MSVAAATIGLAPTTAIDPGYGALAARSAAPVTAGLPAQTCKTAPQRDAVGCAPALSRINRRSRTIGAS